MHYLKLAKFSLDVDTLSSYKPVSHLTQVSKCLEKVIAQQLIEQTSDMTELYQSAYKSNYSTKTELIAVCDDIKRGLDNRKGTALVMIDLSAAFDTINHSILLQRLRNRYGITHTALTWCQSNLAERYQRLSISDNYSQKLKLTTGVPQGSVLDPCCSHYMYNLLEISLENMDSAFIIIQMICNCITILNLVHPLLWGQYIDSKTVLQIYKYGLMKIR